jgi:hypothetical protein
MTLSSLLAQRRALLKQARLASLAFAYKRLCELTGRIARARLQGEVRLQHAKPDAERYWASLTALEGSQSVIEEHFADEDLMDLADIVSHANGGDDVDLTFRIEELADRFLVPVRAQLERSGVLIDHACPQADDATREGTSDRARREDSA